MATISFADMLDHVMANPPAFVTAFQAAGLALDVLEIKKEAREMIRDTPALRVLIDHAPLDPANTRARDFRLPQVVMSNVLAALLPQGTYWRPPGALSESYNQRYKREASQRLVQVQHLSVLNNTANVALAQSNAAVVQRDGVIQQQNGTIAQHKATIDARDDAIAAQNAALAQLRQEALDRDATILALRSTVKADTLRLEELFDQLKIADATTTELTQHLVGARGFIRELQRELHQVKKEILSADESKDPNARSPDLYSPLGASSTPPGGAATSPVKQEGEDAEERKEGPSVKQEPNEERVHRP